MSGTSLDGLDVVEVNFKLSNGNWSFEILQSAHFDFSPLLSKNLLEADKKSALELVQTEIQFSRFCAESINEFRSTFYSEATFVASHGHTIFHQPSQGITLQIGSGAIISSITGLDTICDFRNQDVALGGQGAPLVPLADSQIFSEFECTLNLGGFANLSVLGDSLVGYDITVCNILLNHLSKELGFNYDSEGANASDGQIRGELLEQLNHLEYYTKPSPKSLGKEWFESQVLPIISAHKQADPKDKLSTCVEHIALQIANELKARRTCLVTGGGTFNEYLIERIQFHTNSDLQIPNKQIIEFKEAIDFALLGLLRLREEQNVSSSVTGSSRSQSAGAVYLAK